jgi:hypothetical protein
MDPAKLREAVGLKPDASDDEVMAALAAGGLKVAASAPPPTPDPATPPAPTTDPQGDPVPAPKPTAGTVVMDASQLDEIRAAATRMRVLEARIQADDRDRVITDAIQSGKFPQARRAHWEKAFEADPEGTKATIASMASNLVPIDRVRLRRRPRRPRHRRGLLGAVPSEAGGGLTHGCIRLRPVYRNGSNPFTATASATITGRPARRRRPLRHRRARRAPNSQVCVGVAAADARPAPSITVWPLAPDRPRDDNPRRRHRRQRRSPPRPAPSNSGTVGHRGGCRHRPRCRRHHGRRGSSPALHRPLTLERS